MTDLYSGQAPDWQEDGYPNIWMPYTQMATAPLPVPVVATEGVRMELADGRKLIDGLASWWCAVHGYNHPHIIGAMKAQLDVMPHVMFGGVNHEQALKLARRLAALTPGDLNRVFFSDSGSVAVEVALKMAVQFWLNRGEEGRHKFVCFRHGYHGDTTGAMSVCDPTGGMHSRFKGFLLEQYPTEVPLDEAGFAGFDEFVAARAESLAGIIIEPLVQGAGGMRFHGPETLASLRATADRHNVLLIFDEIATNFCRTGTMFAADQAGVVPDIMCLGKALTGGVMTLAATVATEQVFAAFLSQNPEHALMHGPTFMANPLACAAANASLDLFESEPRAEQALAMESQMREELAPAKDLPGVVDVRAKGAIGVIQVAELKHLDWLKRRFIDEGVWVRPFGDCIYITPSLVMSADDLTTLTAALVTVTVEWAEKG